jgi:hypothetical protein
VVDARVGRERARGGELLARLEVAAVDGCDEAVDELLGDRRLTLPIQIRQIHLV